MSAESNYKTTLAEVRARLLKYVNRIHEAGPGDPPRVPIGLNHRDIDARTPEFVHSLVLLLAEQEMRLRDTERVIEKIGSFASALVIEIKKEFGQDKLDELVRMAQEKAKGEAN